MPHVLDKINKFRAKRNACDICHKPMTTIVSPSKEKPASGECQPNQYFSSSVERTFHFCDKCMQRNSHMLFNSGLEARKFYVTADRRVNGKDLPPLHN